MFCRVFLKERESARRKRCQFATRAKVRLVLCGRPARPRPQTRMVLLLSHVPLRMKRNNLIASAGISGLSRSMSSRSKTWRAEMV